MRRRRCQRWRKQACKRGEALAGAGNLGIETDEDLELAGARAFRYIERDRLDGREIPDRLVGRDADVDLHGVTRDALTLGVGDEHVDREHDVAGATFGAEQNTTGEAVFDGDAALLDLAFARRP